MVSLAEERSGERTYKQHMVRIPSKINFLFACGAFENVAQRCVMSDLSEVGRLSRDCDRSAFARRAFNQVNS